MATSTLTIYFVGICTHLTNDKGRGHRVVLINARQGDPERGIPRHEPKLLVHAHDIHEGTVPELDGVTITVDDVVSPLHYDGSYEACIPNLRQYAHEHIDPDPDVTKKKKPKKVAAHFDFAGGEVRAGAHRPDDRHEHRGHALTYVSITTASAYPTLTIENFSDGAVSKLKLRDGTAIQVQNIGPAKDDANRDFLLHFRIAKVFPRHAKWPRALHHCPTIQPPWSPPDTVGPGCSNSTYP